jgi:hypothetical protein
MTPVWYQLLKEDGTSMGSDMVRLPADSFIADFRDAVKAKNTDLKDIPPRFLIVYRNKAAYENKELNMEEDTAVSGFGDSKKNALVVMVPNLKLEGINVVVNGRNSNVFGYFGRNR